MSLFGNNNAGGTGFGGGGFGANNNNQTGQTGSVFGSGGGFGQPAATGTLVLFACLFLARCAQFGRLRGALQPCCLRCFFGRRDVIGARRDLHARVMEPRRMMVAGDGDDDLRPVFSKNSKSTNPPARVSFQALATQVEGLVSRIRIHQALLVLQRTPVSVQPVEVLLEIRFIIIAIVAIIVCLYTRKICCFP